MINYQKHTLPNGLTVVVNRDRSSKLAAVNLLYKIGARNENPSRTGFAHLFEHLMFRGTKAVPDFDTPVQMACGENNAFTNNDYTDFYITLPKDNIETALWLESDRMTGLDISQENLETEKRVVIEEYKQRYLNQPYGDMSMLLRALAYRVHPYRWATIGLSPDHIAGASLDEVRDFYRRFYHPSNAILSISADIPEERTIVLAYHIGSRTSPDFFLGDMTSDLLAGGESGRLYQHLVREQRLLGSVNAYVSGEVDPGLFVFTAQLLPSTTVEQAEAALLREIEILQTEKIDEYELEKIKNKFEANTLFGELNVMNKAMNLGFYEMLGDLPLINREVTIYRSQTAEQIADFSRRTFRPENRSTLIYRAKQ